VSNNPLGTATLLTPPSVVTGFAVPGEKMMTSSDWMAEKSGCDLEKIEKGDSTGRSNRIGNFAGSGETQSQLYFQDGVLSGFGGVRERIDPYLHRPLQKCEFLQFAFRCF